jgi:hypothetical protein
MAITKQKAQRSTGRKAPRAVLANPSARNPRERRAADEGGYEIKIKETACGRYT